MAQSPPASKLEPGVSTTKAVKDKACPYCGQVFTSSSLGRHLDLYIKEKNPKQPDGIHDVEEIRSLRSGITRRHPRNSIARRDTITPVGTPTTTSASRKSPFSDAGGAAGGSAGARSPSLSRANREAMAGSHAQAPPPEATGLASSVAAGAGRAGGLEGDAPLDSSKRPVPTRAMSRHLVKAQFDMKQKVQDALDTSRAAELALRELLGSWRAAKTNVDIRSMPFDFDPLSLDFPALTLQCLQPPPTLFSSTQHPTPTSWSISAPDVRQFDALMTFFRDAIARWRKKCAASLTVAEEELRLPNRPHSSTTAAEATRTAEEAANTLEQQISDHLESAFAVWDSLPQQRRNELWTLELARSVGRKRSEVDGLKNTNQTLKQENAGLKAQVDHLNRLLQQRDPRPVPPAPTYPISEAMVDFATERGLHGITSAAIASEDRNEELGKLVARTVERWKTVIVNTRAAQRPLDQAAPPATPVTPAPIATAAERLPTACGASVASAPAQETVASPVASAPARTQQQMRAPISNLQIEPKIEPHNASASSAGQSSHLTEDSHMSGDATPTTSSAPPLQPSHPASVSASAPDEDSDPDADADAEMDDDNGGFAAINIPIANPTGAVAAPPVSVPPVPPIPPAEITPKLLEVRRTRGPLQHAPANGMGAISRSTSHNYAAAAARRGAHHMGGVNGGRSVTNVNPAAMKQQQQNRERALRDYAATQLDMDMMSAQSGGGEPDPMYMD